MKNSILSLICLIFILTLSNCVNQPQVKDNALEVTFLNSEEREKMDLPFSEAVRVGNMLYLSGQLGAKPGEMGVVEGGIKAETRQTLENIKEAIERFGGSMEDIIKCTIFLADISEWPAMNEVYVEYFKKPYPARSAVAGSGLALNARVEIECIAVLKDDK